jgi:hypothetical protein
VIGAGIARPENARLRRVFGPELTGRGLGRPVTVRSQACRRRFCASFCWVVRVGLSFCLAAVPSCVAGHHGTSPVGDQAPAYRAGKDCSIHRPAPGRTISPKSPGVGLRDNGGRRTLPTVQPHRGR